MNKKSTVQSPQSIKLDRLPPNDGAAEQGVLGCVLLAPTTCMDEADEKGLTADWFYDLRHQTVWHAITWLREHGQPVIDVITLQGRLKDMNMLDEVGGIAYLAQLQDAVPSAANIFYYLDKVRDKWLLRKMVQTGTNTVGRVFDYEGEVDALVDEVMTDFRLIEELAQGRTATERELATVILEEVIPGIEKNYHRGAAQIEGLTTGLAYLDKMLSGMGGDNGNYLVCAGRPGTGKTALAIQIAQHVALEAVWWTEKKDAAGNVLTKPDEKTGEPRALMDRHQGKPVGIFSLEMSRKSLGRRMLFQQANADLQRWRTGFATNADLVPLVKAAETLAKAGIYIDESPGITVGQLKARARRWHRQHGVRFFVVDYFQLLRGEPRRRQQSQVEELEDISHELLTLGKELDCPILVLCQMNRDWERDPTRTPQLSDLKGCGAVEQDAHVVMFLYRPKLGDTAKDFYESCMEQKFGPNWRKWDGHPHRVNGLVAKNREGPTGKAELLFLRSSTKFHDWNGWLKENKLKAAASGEGQYKGEELDVETGREP
jgi:replicative DNA helicase